MSKWATLKKWLNYHQDTNNANCYMSCLIEPKKSGQFKEAYRYRGLVLNELENIIKEIEAKHGKVVATKKSARKLLKNVRGVKRHKQRS